MELLNTKMILVTYGTDISGLAEVAILKDDPQRGVSTFLETSRLPEITKRRYLADYERQEEYLTCIPGYLRNRHGSEEAEVISRARNFLMDCDIENTILYHNENIYHTPYLFLEEELEKFHLCKYELPPWQDRIATWQCKTSMFIKQSSVCVNWHKMSFKTSIKNETRTKRAKLAYGHRCALAHAMEVYLNVK